MALDQPTALEGEEGVEGVEGVEGGAV